MKKITVLLAAAFLAAGLLAGCGDSVDEGKTPEQIKLEVAGWDSARIQKSIDGYKKAIDAKAKELDASLAEFKKLSPEELLGGKGRELKAEADKIGASLSKLTKNMEAYVDGLKAKTTGK